MTPALDALRSDLDAVVAQEGTISVWAGPVGGPPAFTRDADAPHYAASTTKVAILVALYRAAEAGLLSVEDQVVVRNEFASSQPGAAPFGIDLDEDNDDAVTARMDAKATLRWLADRMIVRSSNLATNLVLSAVRKSGMDVNDVWRDVGATNSKTERGIDDKAARIAGLTNQVTAADLAALFSAIARGTAATPESCQTMMRTLLAQEYREDLPAGLPPGTPVASKNGWITGVRHGCGVVLPRNEAPFVLTVCTTTTLGEAEGAALVATVAEAAWRDRKAFT